MAPQKTRNPHAVNAAKRRAGQHRSPEDKRQNGENQHQKFLEELEDSSIDDEISNRNQDNED
jgi:hypothetical protein